MTEARRLPVGTVPAAFEGPGRAPAYARMWLDLAGAEAAPGGTPIRLWDFQVGMEGSGADASAVAGPAAAIGHADGPGVPLPSMPTWKSQSRIVGPPDAASAPAMASQFSA